MKPVVYGIDLGTTNSCISRFVDSHFDVIEIDGSTTMPSVLAHDNERWLVGREALNYSMLYPERAIRSIKRRMGDETFIRQLGGETLTPTDVSSKILAYLKEKTEAKVGEQVRDVVITVPAWFNDAQRQATISAGVLAGLNVLRITNEPTAASLAYEQLRPKGADPLPEDGTSHWVVYDLGGGTFDVSVLAVSKGYKEVLASCGDSLLGGDDFDHRLSLDLAREFHKRCGVDISKDVAAMARFCHLAEKVKIALSTKIRTEINEMVSLGDQQHEFHHEITRQQFEQLISDYIESTLTKTQQALEEAHIRPNQIDRLLLVGGSIRIPLVAQAITERFSLHSDAYVEPDLSVAVGACLQASILSGLNFDTVVVDVAPRTLGVAVLGARDFSSDMDDDFEAILDGICEEESMESSHNSNDRLERLKANHPRTFAPLIARNTKVPARFVKEFFTCSDNQKHIEVAVYQGESDTTRENTFVGSFLVKLSPRPAHSPIAIGFSYDLNGVVQISVDESSARSQVKNYTMDLNRSVHLNCDSQVFNKGRRLKIDDFEDWDDNTTNEEAIVEQSEPYNDKEVINLLIQRVEAKLKDPAKTEGKKEVEGWLQAYRNSLRASDNANCDRFEDLLYEWVTQ